MRQSITEQLPLTPVQIDHKFARELEAIDEILNKHPEMTELVMKDLSSTGCSVMKGRRAMSAEQVLRCLIIKQMNQFSYEELSFHLADSSSYRRFCVIGAFSEPLKKSALQANLSRISADTFEKINFIIVSHAMKEGVETGDKTRTDCTVVESNIHEPSDSSLLYDTVRVLARIMKEAAKDFDITFTNHTRRAKRRSLGILNARKDKRGQLYADLLKVTKKTLSHAGSAISKLEEYSDLDAFTFVHCLRHYMTLGEQVYNQTWRRVINNESVPASDKIVSIFEEHSDIIIKKRREILYGHKICLTTGASNLILDCVIEDGNPSDSTLAVDMVQRLEKITGSLPSQVAFDGGFASKDNLAEIKELGVEDVMFSKKRGLKISDMVKESRVYKALRNFRAGIEGVISFLKRVFGLGRCQWRGLNHFKSYVWSSVIAANLLTLARHQMARA